MWGAPLLGMEETMKGDRDSRVRRPLSVLINALAIVAVALVASACVIETDGGGYHHHHWHGWHEWR